MLWKFNGLDLMTVGFLYQDWWWLVGPLSRSSHVSSTKHFSWRIISQSQVSSFPKFTWREISWCHIDISYDPLYPLEWGQYLLKFQSMYVHIWTRLATANLDLQGLECHWQNVEKIGNFNGGKSLFRCFLLVNYLTFYNSDWNMKFCTSSTSC